MDFASTGHGIRGIAQQVKKDLLELARIDHDLRQCGPRRVVDTHFTSLQTWLKQFQRIVKYRATSPADDAAVPAGRENSRKSRTMCSSLAISSETIPNLRTISLFPWAIS